MLLKILHGGRIGMFRVLLALQDVVDLPALLCSRTSFNNGWTLRNSAGDRTAPPSPCLSQDFCVSLETYG